MLGERLFDAITRAYDRTLTVALLHPAITMIIFLATFAVNAYLFTIVPKGFFPSRTTVGSAPTSSLNRTSHSRPSTTRWCATRKS